LYKNYYFLIEILQKQIKMRRSLQHFKEGLKIQLWANLNAIRQVICGTDW